MQSLVLPILDTQADQIIRELQDNVGEERTKG
jgi:hypothetical protein